jgi:ADP-ribose pyrophosphatase YjhB (NUDIX family)
VPDRWWWELPGGMVDTDEKPADAAIRKLEEETRYRAENVEHLITFQGATENRRHRPRGRVIPARPY